MLQSWMLRMVLAADATPENGVLRFRIKNHTIEIKKGCL